MILHVHFTRRPCRPSVSMQSKGGFPMEVFNSIHKKACYLDDSVHDGAFTRALHFISPCHILLSRFFPCFINKGDSFRVNRRKLLELVTIVYICGCTEQGKSRRSLKTGCTGKYSKADRKSRPLVSGGGRRADQQRRMKRGTDQPKRSPLIVTSMDRGPRPPLHPGSGIEVSPSRI